MGLLVLGSNTSDMVSLLYGRQGTLLTTRSVVDIFGLGTVLLVVVLLADMIVPSGCLRSDSCCLLNQIAMVDNVNLIYNHTEERELEVSIISCRSESSKLK